MHWQGKIVLLSMNLLITASASLANFRAEILGKAIKFGCSKVLVYAEWLVASMHRHAADARIDSCVWYGLRMIPIDVKPSSMRDGMISWLDRFLISATILSTRAVATVWVEQEITISESIRRWRVSFKSSCKVSESAWLPHITAWICAAIACGLSTDASSWTICLIWLSVRKSSTLVVAVAAATDNSRLPAFCQHDSTAFLVAVKN